jgi:Dolichyl-phosphate-mannose-protein mannosyltransferase
MVENKAKPRIAIVIGIFSLAFVTRIINLMLKPLWLDEELSISIASFPLNFSDWQDMHPFGYYFLLKMVMVVVGENYVVLRLISVIFSTLSVVLVFLIAEKLYDYKMGIFCALVQNFNYLSLQQAQEIRMYALDSFFVALCTYLFLLYLENAEDNKNGWRYFICSLLFLNTDFLGIFLLGIHFLFGFLYFKKNYSDRSILKKFGFGFMLLGFNFVIWLIMIPSNLGMIEWIDSPTISLFVEINFQLIGINPHIFKSHFSSALLYYVLFFTFLFFIFIAIVANFNQYNQAKHLDLDSCVFLGVFIPYILWFISYLILPIFKDRYAAIFNIFYIIALLRGMRICYKFREGKIGIILKIIIIIIFLYISGLILFSFYFRLIAVTYAPIYL